MNDDRIYQKVLETSKELQNLGFYVKASCPLDWDNTRKQGYDPQIMRGGTHIEYSHINMIGIIHGSFIIKLLPNEVFALKHIEEVHFNNLNDIVFYLERLKELELYQ